MKLDGIYHGNPGSYSAVSSGIELQKLPKGSVIDIIQIQGNVSLDDCGQAEVLLNYSQQGAVATRGGTLPKTGFFGVVLMEGGMVSSPGYWDVRVEDNQDLVIGDYYSDSTFDHLFVGGSPRKTGGRVTIQGIKQSTYVDPNLNAPNQSRSFFLSIDNYGGQVFYSDSLISNVNPVDILQKGENHCDLVLMNNILIGRSPDIKLQSSARFISIHNIFESEKSTKGRFGLLPDKMPEGSLQIISNGLDHLRELGDLNLKMHHPQ